MVIETRYGAVRGKPDGAACAYLGIPFAAPPVGELRFRAPQPPQPWPGVLNACRYPKNPMQPNKTNDYSLCSEDCLYLNVWVPDGPHQKPLPVMVWLYGGGYETGGVGANDNSGEHALYELGLFAQETGCIVVAANYRLNVFGFLNFSFLDPHFEDNLGIKDQIAALQWVRQNIAAFGGDETNVTVFGESAGAGSVSVLLAIPQARALFHKAIMQSNCFESVYTKAEAQQTAQKYLECLGAKSDDPGALLTA